MSNSCQNCRFAYTRDIGYSSYTIEGTVLGCRLGQNPFYERGYERYDREDTWEDQYASQCDEYNVGPRKHYAVEDGYRESYKSNYIFTAYLCTFCIGAGCSVCNDKGYTLSEERPYDSYTMGDRGEVEEWVRSHVNAIEENNDDSIP